MNVINEAYVSVCGVCCTICGLYREDKCPGCLELESCKILKCAKSREKEFCFDCDEFPCELQREGFDWDLDQIPEVKESGVSPGEVRWKVYSPIFIDFYKRMKES